MRKALSSIALIAVAWILLAAIPGLAQPYLYVAENDYMGGYISVIDTATDELTDTFRITEVPGWLYWVAIHPDGSPGYAGGGPQHIYEFVWNQSRRIDISALGNVRFTGADFSPDARTLYLAHAAIVRFDLASEWAEYLWLRDPFSELAVSRVSISESGATAYIMGWHQPSRTQMFATVDIDPDSETYRMVLYGLSLPLPAFEMAVMRNRPAVFFAGELGVYLLDLSSGEISWLTDRYAAALALDPIERSLTVSDSYWNRVLLFDTDSMLLVAVLGPFPTQPTRLAFHPDGSKLYVAGYGGDANDEVYTVDLKSGEILATFRFREVRGLAIR
jgi:hypothetical protein